MYIHYTVCIGGVGPSVTVRRIPSMFPMSSACPSSQSIIVHHGPPRSVEVRLGPLQSATFYCGPPRSIAVRRGLLRFATVYCGPPRSIAVRHGLLRSVTIFCCRPRSYPVRHSLLRSATIRNGQPRIRLGPLCSVAPCIVFKL